jgi:hypothetical protein
MYKQVKPMFEGAEITTIQRFFDNAFIPFDPANTDYQQFKKDIMAGGELQDADGVVMANAKEFVRSLP